MINFYNDISPFHEFELIGNMSYFHQAPDDWIILITDIKYSTRVATEGRSKDVNMLGAAVITLVSNKLNSLRIPFIFGGDGATLLMPVELFQDLRKSLVGLMKLAESEFQIGLRIGAVSVNSLLSQGHSVLVGKYQTNPNSQFAQFIGSGFLQAEKLIKGEDSRAICLKLSEEYVNPNLNGLSCRLQPFSSNKGEIVSLIVKPMEDMDGSWTRGYFLQELKKILNDNFRSANPIKSEKLNWKIIPTTFWAEVAFASFPPFNTAKVFAKVLLANTILKFNISLGGFIPNRYKSEVPIQSDYIKFDDNLRMVIDCSEQEVAALIDLLEKGKAEGFIIYGLHKTKSAVVTCITHTAAKGEHIHLVDGENCGYTMAASQIKMQLATKIK
jgi:hypothetical protein